MSRTIRTRAQRRLPMVAAGLTTLLFATACGTEAPGEGDPSSALPVAVVGADPQPSEPSGEAGEAGAVTVEVTMTDNSFTPGAVTVPRGGTVVWRNTSSMVHTVTGDGFDSGSLAPGASYRRTFSTPGSHPYHCVPHRQAGMVGQVVVK